MPVVQAFEEAVYEGKLGDMITLLLIRNVRREMCEDGAPVSPSIQLVVLRWLFDDLWFFRAHDYWQKDVGFEVRWKVPPRGVRTFIE